MFETARTQKLRGGGCSVKGWEAPQAWIKRFWEGQALLLASLLRRSSLISPGLPVDLARIIRNLRLRQRIAPSIHLLDGHHPWTVRSAAWSCEIRIAAARNLVGLEISDQVESACPLQPGFGSQGILTLIFSASKTRFGFQSYNRFAPIQIGRAIDRKGLEERLKMNAELLCPFSMKPCQADDQKLEEASRFRSITKDLKVRKRRCLATSLATIMLLSLSYYSSNSGIPIFNDTIVSSGCDDNDAEPYASQHVPNTFPIGSPAILAISLLWQPASRLLVS